jgi:hypothetical protein
MASYAWQFRGCGKQKWLGRAELQTQMLVNPMAAAR